MLRTGINYSTASTLSSVVAMIVSFINMRWLEPELLGIWQSLTIINAYLPFLQLGIQSGLNLELPVELGKGNTQKASSLVATAKSFAVSLATILSVVGIVAVLILWIKGADPKIIWGALALSIMAVTTCFRGHFIATYRSAKAFDRLAKIYYIDTFVNVLMIYLIYKYLYYGLLLYCAAKEVIMTTLLYIYAPYKKEHRLFNKNDFAILFKRGLFMSIYNELKNVINSFPRIILLYFGGAVEVGLFTPALNIGTLILMIPRQLAQFLQPQMGYKYGETGMAKDMWPYLKKLTLLIPLFILPVSLVGWVLMPYVLDYLFPKYLDSLWPMRIMLIGFIFSINLTRGFIITIKAYKECLLLQLADALCLIVLPLIFIKAKIFSITIDMSLGLSIGYLITYIINYFIIRNTVFAPKYNMAQSIDSE